MNLKNIFSWLTVIFFITVFCFLLFYWKGQSQVNNIHFVEIAGQMVKVDLALTSEEQKQGLSGRVDLKENEGMLFVFEKSAINLFWMKDMNFPIDMIWFDENMNVIYMQKNSTPESYPESFGPKENSKYVLEVVAGFTDKYNLQIGDRMEVLQ